VAAKKEKEAPSSVASVLANLRKEKQIGSMSDIEFTQGAFSTGNIAVDFRTGIGGYPKGRIVDQHGPKSSGKTTLALQGMAKAQKEIIETEATAYVMFLDYEKTFDVEYAENLGLDTSHSSFIYYAPVTFEEGANAYRELLQTGELRFAVFDSVAAMITEKEIASETGAAMVADRAKLMHQFCRQIVPVLERTNSTVIFLNHIMEKVDATWAGQQMAAKGIKQYVRPGGTALDFYSSLTLEFKQKQFHKVSEFDALTNEKVDTVLQTDILMTIVKNKVAKPQGQATLRVRFGKGFSQAYSVVQILLAHKVIKKAGAWHYVPAELAGPGMEHSIKDGKIGFQGEEKLIKAMEARPDWLAILEAKAAEILADSNPETGELNVVDDFDVDALLEEKTE
jgi:recombination protein RecA